VSVKSGIANFALIHVTNKVQGECRTLARPGYAEPQPLFAMHL